MKGEGYQNVGVGIESVPRWKEGAGWGRVNGGLRVL